MWLVYNKFTNGDTGQLPYSVLSDALKEINSAKTKEDLKDLCMILQINQDEEIDFVKFKKLVKHKSRSKF